MTLRKVYPSVCNAIATLAGIITRFFAVKEAPIVENGLSLKVLSSLPIAFVSSALRPDADAA